MTHWTWILPTTSPDASATGFVKTIRSPSRLARCDLLIVLRTCLNVLAQDEDDGDDDHLADGEPGEHEGVLNCYLRRQAGAAVSAPRFRFSWIAVTECDLFSE